MSQCHRFTVTGRVQGVWFRQSTLERATELGLTGWVRNRADGRVELLACGEAKALEQLRLWLWEGPRMAEVSGVDEEAAADTPPADFSVR